MIQVKNPVNNGHDMIVNGTLFLLPTKDVPTDGDLYCNEDGDYFICHSLRDNLKIGFPGTPFKVLPFIISNTEKYGKNDLVICQNEKDEYYLTYTSWDNQFEKSVSTKKVLVHSSQINKDILQYIVSKKLSHGDKVKVRCVQINPPGILVSNESIAEVYSVSESESPYKLSYEEKLKELGGPNRIYVVELNENGLATISFKANKNPNKHKPGTLEYAAFEFCKKNKISGNNIKHVIAFAKSNESREYWFDLFRTTIH